jgi:hypothetical protein
MSSAPRSSEPRISSGAVVLFGWMETHIIRN